jgi:hypothetical protein
MFDTPESNKPDIVLDEDATAVVKRMIKETQEALASLVFFMDSPEPLEHESARSVLSVAEYRMADIGKKLGVETMSGDEIERRHLALRTANGRVRELEAQLGNAQSPQLTQLGVRTLEERINAWWRHEGFGLVSETTFGPYICKVKLSCGLYGDYSSTLSETPISDKERKRLWLQSLREQGYVLTDEKHEVGVLDCDASRAALCAFISSRLPTARVVSFENHVRRQGGYVLRGAEVVIRDWEEIIALPVGQPEQPESEV